MMADAKPTLRLVDIDEKLSDPKSDAGRIAAGIREGRRRERTDWCKRLGVQSAEEAAEIGHLRAELKRRITPEEEDKHVRAGRYQGVVMGVLTMFVIGGIGLAWYTTAIIGPTFDAASRSRFDQMAVEAITQERPPTTEAPRSESAGEPLN